MRTVIVIPARMGSTRFPNKPLVKIAGKPMIQRVWEIAKQIQCVERVIIGTDHPKLYQFAQSLGAEVVLTSSQPINGSERTWEVVQQLDVKPDLIMNLQGDAVLTPPWVLQPVLDYMRAHPETPIATPAALLSIQEWELFHADRAAGNTTGTFVVFGTDHQALYFSKALIPFHRQSSQNAPQVYRHIGVYAYRYDSLKQYVSLPPGLLEQTEQLEQLRAIENHLPIQVVLVDYKGRTPASVDEPQDVQRVEQIIQQEGELIA